VDTELTYGRRIRIDREQRLHDVSVTVARSLMERRDPEDDYV
jgi:hypothetical protein